MRSNIISCASPVISEDLFIGAKSTPFYAYGSITNTANSSDYTRTYSYDIIGNITNKSDVGTYSYTGDHPHAVTSANSVTYTYDANGSLTGDGTWTHTYDTRNRLTNSDDGSTSVDYQYDEARQRTLKDDGTTANIYANKYYEEEDDGSTNTVRHFIYAGDMKVAKKEGAVTTFIHNDHLSGSNVSTDTNGDPVELNDYYPYGDARIEDRVGSYENDYTFTGQEHDEETGQYYYGARYYNSGLGRFTSQDPWFGDIENPQSLNKYSYVLNNPLRYVDPTGMIPDPTDVIAIPCPFCGVVKEIGEMLILGAAVGIVASPDPVPPITVDPLPQPKPSEPYTSPYYGPHLPTYNDLPAAPNIFEGPLVMPLSQPDWLNQGPLFDTKIPDWIDVPGKAAEAPEGYQWVGPGKQGSKEGSYLNPKTGEGLRPDLEHAPPIGPHWDYKPGEGEGFTHRVPEGGGKPEPKKKEK